jgi:uncharacterized protein Yka (UPF0111/DUF47 family)
VREAEHRADDAKRELREALRETLMTPLEPEDILTLSREIDWILNHAKDLVRESEVMACPPDAPVAQMAASCTGAARRLARTSSASQNGSCRRPSREDRVALERRLTSSSCAHSRLRFAVIYG